MKFAFFDFDGTLTTGDSFMPFLKALVGQKNYYLKIILLMPTLMGYLLGWVKNDVAKVKVLSAFLKNKTVNEIELFAQQHSFDLRPEGMKALRDCQQSGYICILVSASPALFLRAWAKQNGFQTVIATELETINGQFTGLLAGENCFGMEKVKRIETLFGKNCWKNSVAYSDSKADLPMLNQAESAFLWQNNQFIAIK